MEGDVGQTQRASKSAKKNQKRKNASNPTKNKTDELDYEKMLSQLKQKLEEAKAKNDHQKAAELRNQVWVLTDMTRGIRTNISDEDMMQILENISKEIGTMMQMTTKQKKAGESESAAPVVSSIQSNRMRNLQKKLDQIEVLKERINKGEKLETNQLEKINSEDMIREEMKQLTEILSNIELKQ